jgi:hypothetical protein
MEKAEKECVENEDVNNQDSTAYPPLKYESVNELIAH